VRGRRGPAGEGGLLAQYVNDRPYVASSFLSVAIAQVFGTWSRTRVRGDGPSRPARTPSTTPPPDTGAASVSPAPPGPQPRLTMLRDQRLTPILSPAAFRFAVLRRDGARCVACPPNDGAAVRGVDRAAGDGSPIDVHHLLHPRLWTAPDEEGGHIVDNGVTLCAGHRREAEATRLTVARLRELAGIARAPVPAFLSAEDAYDHWGNVLLPNGTRLRGPLFDDGDCQRALAAGGVLGDFTPYVKQHRIAHVPWSEGVAADDVHLADMRHFTGREVVVTAKLDGESTTLYPDHLHARSLDSLPHPSQSKVRQFHATVRGMIPDGWRVVVENCAAVHTYRYEHLESLFPVTAIWNERNERLPWDEVTAYAEMLGLPTAPVLYRGSYDEALVRACQRGEVDGDPQEGWVLSLAESFPYGEAHRRVVKFVSGAFRQALERSQAESAALGRRGHWRFKPVEWNRRRADSPWAA
jgi:hypothetical protein